MSTYTGKKRGFTMIEAVIYFSLSSIFLVTILELYTAALQSQLESQSYTSVVQDGNFLLAKLAYEIRNAASITTPSQPTGVTATTINCPTDGSTCLQYAVATPPYGVSDITPKYIRLDGTILKEGAALLSASRILGDDSKVSSMSFERRTVLCSPAPCTNNSKDTILIQFTLTSSTNKLTGDVAYARTFSTVVALR
jgi:Tfp pilus assembly protein PilW